MTNHRQALEKPAAELETLAGEHSQIHRRYADLDDAILQGLGSKQIIESARELVRAMLLHFIHEEQFLEKITLSPPEEQRNAGKKVMAELLKIETGLMQEEVYAALRLRGLCRRWMREHLYVEGVEFEIAVLAANNEAAMIPAMPSSAASL
jgi:hemerythrin